MQTTGRGIVVCLGLGAMVAACAAKAPPQVPRAEVEAALDAFVATLAADPPPAAELPARIRGYLEAHPRFFGSTVALIGADGRVTDSPYLHRSGGTLVETNLATPAYDIDRQAWLAEPRDGQRAVWTAPYFDAGGGDIWMVTRSVPLLRDGRVYAVATTDIPVAAPR